MTDGRGAVEGIDELTTMRELLAEVERWRILAARGKGKAKVSLRDLASSTGVPRSSLASYLAGTTQMPADVLDSVVLALGATAVEARKWAEAWDRATGARVVPVVPGPRQLPAGIADFTGRDKVLSQLDALVDGSLGVIAVVTGTAGVGKTALALHWGHRVAPSFTDGQLYLNLYGYDSHEPMPVGRALERLLRALGVESVPADIDERAAAYRSVLAEQSVLIILDNAHSADQVRPLLPGGAGNRVVVTSRDDLAGIVARDGAHRLVLDRLSHVEATKLLERLVGGERVLLEAEACDELIRRCAGLPLALRLAAERVVARVHGSFADLVEELRVEGLDLLAVAGDPLADVRAVFRWSYRPLSSASARSFRLLGLIPGPDIDLHAASSLFGMPVGAARRLLESLCRSHLVEPMAQGRYTMHDLLRVYAAELSHVEDSSEDRRAALTRLLDWYLHGATLAMDVVHPHRHFHAPIPERAGVSHPQLRDSSQATAWLDAERAGLVAAIDMAATGDWPVHAWQLAATAWMFFNMRGYHDDWISSHLRALEATTQLGDQHAEAEIRNSLGIAHFRTGHYEQAADYYRQALPLRRTTGDRRGEASTLGNLGVVCDMLGRNTEAAEQYQQALSIFRELGDRRGEAVALANLSVIYEMTGRYEEAIQHFEQSLALYGEEKDFRGEALALGNLGSLLTRMGRAEEAYPLLTRSLEIAERLGDHNAIAYALTCLGRNVALAGNTTRAMEYHRQGIAIARQSNDRDGEAAALTALGVVLASLGQHAKAVGYQQDALTLSQELCDPGLESHVLNDLGETRFIAELYRDSLEDHLAALTVALTNTNRFQQGRAHAGVARSSRALGDNETAVEHARQARDIFIDLTVPELDDMQALLARLSNVADRGGQGN